MKKKKKKKVPHNQMVLGRVAALKDKHTWNPHFEACKFVYQAGDI